MKSSISPLLYHFYFLAKSRYPRNSQPPHGYDTHGHDGDQHRVPVEQVAGYTVHLITGGNVSGIEFTHAATDALPEPAGGEPKWDPSLLPEQPEPEAD